mmetsp:Transcript_42827/g.63538  ORF Transcript_42827/g.63538 Transcript_42827/m.63538 type:complete len:213 (-) Transcript_42827:326-964(-)
MVVVRLVVFVPVVSRFDSIKVPRLARTESFLPRVRTRARRGDFVCKAKLLFQVSKTFLHVLWSLHLNFVVLVHIGIFVPCFFLFVRRFLVKLELPFLQVFELPHKHFRVEFRQSHPGQLDVELFCNGFPIFDINNATTTLRIKTGNCTSSHLAPHLVPHLEQLWHGLSVKQFVDISNSRSTRTILSPRFEKCDLVLCDCLEIVPKGNNGTFV